MTLEELRPQVEALMIGSAEGQTAHWIHHVDEGDDYPVYCNSCAKEVLAEMVLLGQYCKDFPAWANCTPDTLEVQGECGSYEDDGSCTCNRCGAMLDASLTLHGVQSELEHFERHGISTPREWREINAVIEGIEFVELAWFPGSWMRQSEAQKARNLYDRTVALLEKNLPAKE